MPTTARIVPMSALLHITPSMGDILARIRGYSRNNPIPYSEMQAPNALDVVWRRLIVTNDSHGTQFVPKWLIQLTEYRMEPNFCCG